MDNKILTLCITLVLGVILVGSLLVPVLNDSEKDYKVTNGFGNLATLDADGSDVINGEITQTKIEINTDSWTRADLTYNWTAPIVADTFVVKTLVTSGGVSIAFAYILNGTSTVLTTDSNHVATVSVAAEEGTAEITVTYSDSTSDTSLTIPYNWIVYMDKEGNHVIQTLPWTGTFDYIAYFNDFSDIRGASYKSTTFYSYVGENLTYGTTSYTASATTSDVSGVVNVHMMSNNGANLVFDTNKYIDIIVAPLTVYGTTEAMDGYANLFNVLPILVIISLVLGAVGFIMVRRQD